MAAFEKAGEPEKAAYEQALLDTLDIISAFAGRYREEAGRVGNQAVADTFSRIPD